MNVASKRTRRLRAARNGFAIFGALAIGCGSAEPSTSEAPAPTAQREGKKSVPEVTDASAAFDVGARLDSSPPDASDSGVSGSPVGEASDAYAAPDSAEASSPSTGPLVCDFTPCAPGAPCPDLIVDLADLTASTVIATQTFLPTDCALVEGCITTPGTRRLLRFDTAVVNTGTADLTIGDPTTHACFQYSDCHMHYHFKGVGQYTLYQADGTTVAAVGHKQGFCLEDVEPYTAAPGPVPTTPFFTCQSQGLHVGWEDVYPSDIDCQWIDVTGVMPGNYVLSVVINGGHYLPESNYANDEARVPVVIPPP